MFANSSGTVAAEKAKDVNLNTKGEVCRPTPLPRGVPGIAVETGV